MEHFINSIGSRHLKTTSKKEFWQNWKGGGYGETRGNTPFNYIERFGRGDRYKLVIGESQPYPKLDYLASFPSRIWEIYCVQYGRADDTPWFLLCKLNSSLYVAFDAHCTYTGFSTCGNIKITVSRSLERLVRFGLTDVQRQILMKAQGLKG